MVYFKELSKTIKLVHISHPLSHFITEPTIRFSVDGNDEGYKISFRFFPRLEISLIDFSGKTIFVLGSVYNKSNLFPVYLLKSGSKGLNSGKNEEL